MDPDGRLYFEGSGGVTIVRPEDPDNGKEEDIPLNFDVITVNGKLQPNTREEIVLDYRETMLSFWYSGLKFGSGTSLIYAYQMEGFDKGWIDAGNSRRTTYSTLPSGKYTFRVKVRKPDGAWSKNVLRLAITVRPAPWATPWAIALYTIAGIGLLCLAIGLVIRWRLQEERLRLAECQKELDQAHIDFMTNISHELRTPSR